MISPSLRALAVSVALATGCTASLAQGRPDPKALLAAQRETMGAFSFMEGVWRGTASTLLPSGDTDWPAAGAVPQR